MPEVASKTYKAFQLTKCDPQAKHFESVERSLEKPLAHQVVIKIHAASLNYRDILISRGVYGRIPLPVVPLSDGAGEVVQVGEKVKKWQVGDRVCPAFMPDWTGGAVNAEVGATALGAFVDGVGAEYVVFDESALVRIPEHLSYEEAATLPCAAVTAWNALFDGYRLKPGQTVLTLGTGGVSIFALQLAKMAGAKVISTSSSDEKIEKLKALGATQTINYKSNPKWEKEVLEYTGGKGVDVVVEVGGVGTLDRSVKSTKVGGHIALIGVLAQADTPFNPVALLMKSITMQGVFVGSRSMFEELNAAVGRDKLKPVIDRVFSADKLVEALDYMESGQHFGKVVVKF